MELVNSFHGLLQVFVLAMTEPTAVTFCELACGWIFAPRRTVLGMFRGSGTPRHQAAFYHVFAAAKWSVDQVGLAVFDLALRWAPQETVFLAGDDTLLARCGLKIFGAGMHRDPLLSSRGHTVTRWGHCWVVLSIIIESPRTPGRYFALPILMRLYLNKQAASKWRRQYRSKTTLMIEMLKRLDQHAGDQNLHFLGDSAYTAPAVLARIPRQIDVTGRVEIRARLHAPAPQYNGRGRPRVRGARLASPGEMLDEKGLKRRTLSLYQLRPYQVRLAEAEGCLYRTPDRLVKVVAVEHLRGGRGREVFYSTRTDIQAEQILQWFSRRWSIEVTFHECKQHLGVDEPENRTREAVRHAAPTGFLLYSLVTIWHEHVRPEAATPQRTYRGKTRASFADMLAALRTDSFQQFQQKHLSTPGIPPAVEKLMQRLEHLIQLAA